MRINVEKIIALFQVLLMLSLQTAIPLSISFASVPAVAAEDEPADIEIEYKPYCCERTVEGAWCQTVMAKDDGLDVANKCDITYASSPIACEELTLDDDLYSKCITGCYITEDGVCSENVPKIIYDEAQSYSPGEFKAGLSCDEVFDASGKQVCVKVCCVIAGQYTYTTNARCNLLAEEYGVFPIFKPEYENQGQCLRAGRESSDDEGCCVIDGSYIYTTQSDCNAKGANPPFHWKTFCSSIDSPCTKHARTACVEGRDEIYWFDSCGNREEIYGASVINGNENQANAICKSNADDGNINNADCGWCNPALGSACGLADSTTGFLNDRQDGEEVICRDTTCWSYERDGSRGTRNSGESWCIYDSQPGKDVVGSVHWRATCKNGIQYIEQCSDRRQEICAEKAFFDTNEDGDVGEGDIVEALCEPNPYSTCLDINAQEREYNDAGELTKRIECEETPLCFWYKPPQTEDCNPEDYWETANDESKICQWKCRSYSHDEAFEKKEQCVVDNECRDHKEMNKRECEEQNQDRADPMDPISAGGSGGDPHEWVPWEGLGANTALCLPIVPPGFNDLSNVEPGEEGVAVNPILSCGLGSYECIVKKTGGSYVRNPECMEAEWAIAMNDRCMAIGDCGASVNILGIRTDPESGYHVYKGEPPDPLDEDATDEEKQKFVDDWRDAVDELLFESEEYSPEGQDYLDSIIGDAIILPKRFAGRETSEAGETTLAVLIGNFIRPLITGKQGWIPGVTSPVEITAIDLGSSIQETAAGLIAEEEGGKGLLGQFDKLLKEIGIENQIISDLTAAAGLTLVQTQLGIDPTIAALTSLAFTYSAAFNSFIQGFIPEFLAFAGPWGQLLGLILFSGLLEELIDLFSDFFGGDVSYTLVTFICAPALPPGGGDNCHLCSEFEGRPCTEYRCHSLGNTCEFDDERIESEKCFPGETDDGQSPFIHPVEFADSSFDATHKITDINRGESARVEKKSGDCLDPYTKVNLALTTDKFAKCKMGVEEDMMFLFGGDFWKKRHFLSITPPGVSMFNEGDSDLDLDAGVESTILVVCADKFGNENEDAFKIHFCINTGPDINAPIIERIDPVNGDTLPYETETVEVDVFTNEYAECRWNKENLPYDSMLDPTTTGGEFTCTEFNQGVVTGKWKCSGDLTGLRPIEETGEEGNLFYIKCRDFAPDKNLVTLPYKLFVGEELTIYDENPAPGSVYESKSMQIELGAKTSGGMDDGVATCKYEYSGEATDGSPLSGSGDFGEPSTHHTTEVTLDIAGDYVFTIECEDSAGSTDESEEILIRIEIDTGAPIIVRDYYQGQLLYIITDEDATCKYNIGEDFDFDSEGNNMDDSEEEHTTTITEFGVEYYIRCQDGFGNEAPHAHISKPIEG